MRATIAAALLLAALPAAPALAQPGFVATLAQPAPAARWVARETLWTCDGAICRAPRSGRTSDANECRAVARKAGRVAGFAAAGRMFAAAELDRCNAGIAG